MPSAEPDEEHGAPTPPWQLIDGALVAHAQFADFTEALAFVNRVGVFADAVDHHPDIDIRWNKVTLRLISHDKGRLTRRDWNLAAQLATLFPPARS